MKNNTLFYKKAIQKYGVSPAGVCWNSKYTQYKRFDTITKLIKKDIQSSSLVDAGCGFGEYISYLQKAKKMPMEYIGLDCEPDMIDISSKRYPQYDFFVKDILKDELFFVDYYICSGALNLLNLEQIDIFIKNCFFYSKKAFVFNYLKNITFKDISKEQIIDITKKYTDDIVIKENYLSNDFTIMMRKGEAYGNTTNKF